MSPRRATLLLLGSATLLGALALRRPAAPARPPERAPAPVSAGGGTRGPSTRVATGRAPLPLVQRAGSADREPLAKLAIEQRRRNDQRFERARARWDAEPQDASWAPQREIRLRLALRQDRAEQLLRDLECRTTLCRLEFSAPDTRTAGTLRHARAFEHEAGVQTAAAPSGPAEDRTLVLFIARPGEPL